MSTVCAWATPELIAAKASATSNRVIAFVLRVDGMNRLPTIQVGDESFGVPRSAGRQLHESVGLRQRQKIAGSVGSARHGARSAGIVLHRYREEIRECR